MREFDMISGTRWAWKIYASLQKGSQLQQYVTTWINQSTLSERSQSQRQLLHDLTYTKSLIKLIETESRLVVARAGGGGMGSCDSVGMKLSYAG